MLFAVPNEKIIKWSMVLLLCLCGDVLPKNPFKSGEVRADYPKGCAYLKCKRGDQCVNRKFWCKNPPCPSMLYCSKTRKESLKGPTSCEAVRCSKGFVCLVRARHCRWGEACEQQIARCISEREYYEGPASCVDFRCPSGHRCILRESLCSKAPCKLLKSCANTKDVNSWFEGCKNLGCLSEHECFLRRPDDDCTKAHCKHTPDCLAKSEEELSMNEQCRGWVCPKGQECLSHTEGRCKRDSCISRSCHKPMLVPANSTRSRKHSWRDDIKLSFYSKFYKDTADKNNPPARLSTDNKKSRESVAAGNKKIPANTAIEKIDDRPIYKAPVYVTANAKIPTSSGSSFASPVNTSGHEVQPTVTSLSTWLNHLKLKTGVDAIEVWIRKADKQESYGEFLEWLESVKEMLGTAAYDLWLEEVRAMTVTSTAFQKWLPPDKRNSVRQNENSVNGKNKDLGLDPRLQNSIIFKPNEDYNYSRRGNINVYETGSMKNDYPKEDDYIFPPREEPPTIMPHIAPTVPADPWFRFHPPIPGIFQPTYPFHRNTGHIPPWANQVPHFRDFDPTRLMNPWYQQLPRNWSFQTPVLANPDIARPDIAAWQDQFVPPPNRQQWQRDRDSRDRFFMDRRIESTRSPSDDNPLLTEDPLRYYSRNSANEDTSWMKYFLNPYQTSELIRASGFGGFPMTDENFDGYASRPGFDDDGRISADMPHRRSKHEDSPLNFDHLRYADRGEDRSDDKSLGVPEDTGLYSPISSWPNVDPRLQQYYRYLADYSRRNRKENKNPRDPPPTLVAPGSLRFHRIGVEPRTQSPNRYFPDNARERPRPEYSWPNYKQDHLPNDQKDHLRNNQKDHLLNDQKDHLPNGQKDHLPNHHQDHLPNYQQDHLPNDQKDHLPNYQQDHLPNDQKDHLPNYQQDHLPNDQKDHLPNYQQDHLPYHQQDHLPNYQQDHLPNDQKAHLPNYQRDHWPIYQRDHLPNYQQDHLPIPLDQRGLLFRNREYESPAQPKGVPDLWDPRYRTPLSSIVNRIDGERLNERDVMEKVVPVVSSRRRVSPNVIVPTASEELHYGEDDDDRVDAKNAEDYPVDDEEELHPLLFSLQGYIESPDEGSWQHTIKSSRNSTILPVYTADNDARGQDDCIDYYPGPNDDAANDRSRYRHDIINFFKNPKYGGNADFPNYLKSVLDAEAAIIMRNITGARDVEIKGIKWEYEDEEDEKFVEDPLRVADIRQKTIRPTSELPNINKEDDSTSNTNERRSDDGGSENDYYDDGIDYAERIYSNLEQADGYGLVNNEDAGDYFTDRFYDDPDHKRFKKNRPL